MKKHLVATLLLFTIMASHAQQTPAQEQPAPPKQEKAKTNTAVWISLGTVFFCVYLALNARKMRKKKE